MGKIFAKIRKFKILKRNLKIQKLSHLGKNERLNIKYY